MTSNRRVLPNRRAGENFELRHGGKNALFVITVSYYEQRVLLKREGDDIVEGDASDVRRVPAEVFISGAKAGSEVDAVARDGAILLSLCMQHGVPLETIKHAMTREPDGSASTIVGAVVDRLTERT